MKTFQNTFKELNLTQLEIYAEEWAVEFSIEFDRIILFKDRNPLKSVCKDVMGASIPGRYLILFELSESASSAFKNMIQATAEEAGILSEDLPECATIFAIWKHIEEKYDRLMRATGQYYTGRYDTILDPNINTALKMLKDDNFYRVYKNKSDYIEDDWKFRVKGFYDNKDLPLGIKEEDGKFWVLYDSNKKEKTIEYTPGADDFIEKKVFPCKPGTQWRDVEITLASYEYVKIKTPQGEDSYHFKDINMRDGRTLDKSSALWTLLVVFCRYSGRIDSKTPIHGFKDLSKSISDLNKKLQNVFGIDENFCHKYNKRDGWVAKCQFNDNTFSA